MILFDLAILNSFHFYTIQNQRTSDGVMIQLQFRISLARSLLEQNLRYDLSGYLVRIGRPLSEAVPARLVGRYFTSLSPSSGNKQLPTRRCPVCSHTEKKTNGQDVNQDTNVQFVRVNFALIDVFVFIIPY
jgi:hypothetical protein